MQFVFTVHGRWQPLGLHRCGAHSVEPALGSQVPEPLQLFDALNTVPLQLPDPQLVPAA
jgi:hypothetical protein